MTLTTISLLLRLGPYWLRILRPRFWHFRVRANIVTYGVER